MSVKVRLLRTDKSGTKVYGLKIDNDGHRRTISIGSKAAAEKAKLVADIQVAQGKLGIVAEKKSPTFLSVAKDWLNFINSSRSTGTYTRYKGIVETKLKTLHNRPIEEITRGDVRNVMLHLYKAGASKASIGLIHTAASGVFTHALDDELISVLPTVGILRKLDMQKDKKDVSPFTDEQFGRVLSTVDFQFRIFFETAFHTGARVGELCALQWSDVNFADRLIRISKTAKDQHIQQHTKTHFVREIDMAEKLVAMLVNLKKKDREECFKLGIQQNLVFHDHGKVLSQNTLRRKLSRACIKLGIGHHTIHDIRHTTASLLLSRGVPLLYVSKVLGHSSPKITLDVYSHYMISENRGMINTLDGQKTMEYKHGSK